MEQTYKPAIPSRSTDQLSDVKQNLLSSSNAIRTDLDALIHKPRLIEKIFKQNKKHTA